MMRNFCEDEKLKFLARFDFLDVCLLGETGTGKTFTAQRIHDLSPRVGKPFIAVNCAELSASIIESELFGYEKGAFTGAVASKTGKFEAAAGGTLFLDEIGELGDNMQAKLLKVVEEKHITRVGSIVPRPVNLRIIYATHRDLDVFREDLRYRIAAHTIRLKPLRERPDVIIPLAHQFVRDFNLKSGRKISVSQNALRVLRGADWRGNVRELRTIIEKACLDTLLHADRDEKAHEKSPIAELTSDNLLCFLPQNEFSNGEIVRAKNSDQTTDLNSLDYKEEKKDFDRRLVKMTLAKNNGNVSRTAIELGLSRYGLIKKIKRFKIVFDKEKNEV
jgi:transcriptional regulator with GAF, ATPase, and Fis domain